MDSDTAAGGLTGDANFLLLDFLEFSSFFNWFIARWERVLFKKFIKVIRNVNKDWMTSQISR